MPRLVLTCGVAGSGKSSYARALAEDGWLRLSIDVEAWQRGLTEHPLPTQVTAEIVAQQREELVTALARGRDVVVDYSFWSRARRDEYRALGLALGAEVEVVWFDVPQEELRRRLALRETHPGPDSVPVPDVVLDRYLAGFEAPTPDEAHVTRMPMVERAERDVVLETERLLLTRWQIADAPLVRELWTERDPRVPPHRRIDEDGRPTVRDLEEWIRSQRETAPTLLAVQRRVEGDVIGYCGLIESGRAPNGESEIAFEMLRRVWGRGYATEAGHAVLDWAQSSGHARLWATVWPWNTPSRRVLAKLGFEETELGEQDNVPGGSLVTVLRL